MKRYLLKNIDCAGCASKLEKDLKAALLDESISVDFTTKTIKIRPEQYSHVIDILDRLYPHVEMIDIESNIEQEKKGNHIFRDNFELVKIIFASILFFISILFKNVLNNYPVVEYLIFLIPYITLGYPIIIKAFRSVKNKYIFDENFLILVATIGAIFIHQLTEAVAVMLFYSIGEYLQDLSVEKSRKSIKDLLNLKPDVVTVIRDNNYKSIPAEEVKIGDVIIVRPGEKIPLDGMVVEGTSYVNTSALTGESLPKRVKKGELVLSGMLNESGMLKVRVTKEYRDSTIAKILELVEEATHRKSDTEKFITKFAKYYTPSVVCIALFIAFMPPIVFPSENYSEWIYRALILLVISCPCALVISIPLSYFAGIGRSAREGILVKGSNYLDVLNECRAVAFDKTGTLTKGVFKITEIVTEHGVSKDDLLKYVSYAEVNSNHPIARAIVRSFDGNIDKSKIESFEELKGYGVKAVIEGKEVIVGNDDLMHRENIPHGVCDIKDSVVYVAVEGKFLGYIIVEDEIKKESLYVVDSLNRLGIKKIVMVTGDNLSVARKIAGILKIDEFYANLLPQDKIEKIRQIKEEIKGGKVAFVGDGINDAPVIGLSDIGIAMGGLGSDVAIEAADMVIMDDNPLSVSKIIEISRYTRKIAKQNIVFSLGVKGIFILFGIGGIATMWEAIFADVGVALIAILNSLRVFKQKIHPF